MEFGRLETAALVLLILAVPLLVFPRVRDYALFVIAVAAVLALLSVLYGLAVARTSFWRRAGVLGFSLVVLYLAHGIVAPDKSLVDVLPPVLRQAIE